MALFCPSFNPPIACPRISRNYAIQRSLRSKISISGPSYFDSPKFSISPPSKKAKCSSNLNSFVKVEEEPPTSVIVFVKGLAQSTWEGGIKEAFSRFGEVNRVKVVLDKATKKSLGFAYVWFAREEHARIAIEEMNGQFFEGRFIQVDLARPGSCKTHPKPSPYKF